MGLDGFRVGGFMAESNAGLAEEFLEQCIHGFKAVGVTSIVAQENVMFQKENVVFPAVEENHPVLAKLVVGSKILAKQGAAGFGDDVVFHVDDNLRYLLSHAAYDGAPRGLQFRQ